MLIPRFFLPPSRLIFRFLRSFFYSRTSFVLRFFLCFFWFCLLFLFFRGCVPGFLELEKVRCFEEELWWQIWARRKTSSSSSSILRCFRICQVPIWGRKQGNNVARLLICFLGSFSLVPLFFRSFIRSLLFCSLLLRGFAVCLEEFKPLLLFALNFSEVFLNLSGVFLKFSLC